MRTCALTNRGRGVSFSASSRFSSPGRKSLTSIRQSGRSRSLAGMTLAQLRTSPTATAPTSTSPTPSSTLTNRAHPSRAPRVSQKSLKINSSRRGVRNRKIRPSQRRSLLKRKPQLAREGMSKTKMSLRRNRTLSSTPVPTMYSSVCRLSSVIAALLQTVRSWIMQR